MMTNNYFKNFNILRKKEKQNKTDQITYETICKAEQELRHAKTILKRVKKKYDNLPVEGQLYLKLGDSKNARRTKKQNN